MESIETNGLTTPLANTPGFPASVPAQAKSHHTTEQRRNIVAQLERGERSAVQLAQAAGVTTCTIYAWRKKYGKAPIGTRREITGAVVRAIDNERAKIAALEAQLADKDRIIEKKDRLIDMLLERLA